VKPEGCSLVSRTRRSVLHAAPQRRDPCRIKCTVTVTLSRSDQLLRSLIKLSFGVTDHTVPTRGAAPWGYEFPQADLSGENGL
jgi:hypothetical protein